jgi:hypothetical protein
MTIWQSLLGGAIGLLAAGVYIAVGEARWRNRWKMGPRYDKPVTCLMNIDVTCDKEVPDDQPLIG